MSRTRHIQTRMRQRGIDQQLLALTSDFGKTIQAGKVEKSLLTRKGVDFMLRRLDWLRGQLLKARDKGGVVLVESPEGVQITTYRLNSYRRPRGGR